MQIRSMQAQELENFKSRVVRMGEDWIVCGDFNVNAPSEEYDMLRATLRCESALAQLGFPPTVNDKSFLAPPGWRCLEHSMSVDHVFSNCTVDGLTVLHQLDLSDHYPLELSLTNNR